MKMVKNIVIVAFAASFMFAGIGFHMANNYSTLEDAAVTTTTSYGIIYDLNSSTSVGYDSTLGMMMFFTGPAGVNLRLGWTPEIGLGDGSSVDDLATSTSLGLGFSWWNGGDTLKTSISTNWDYIMAPASTDAAVQKNDTSNLSVVVGFGF